MPILVKLGLKKDYHENKHALKSCVYLCSTIFAIMLTFKLDNTNQTNLIKNN